MLELPTKSTLGTATPTAACDAQLDDEVVTRRDRAAVAREVTPPAAGATVLAVDRYWIDIVASEIGAAVGLYSST